MESTIKFERHMTGASVFRIIVSKFGHQEEPSPIILLEIDKDSEVGLHSAILSLGLAIGLRMKGR